MKEIGTIEVLEGGINTIQKLFTLEEAEIELKARAEAEKKAKLEEKKRKAIERTKLLNDFQAKVLELQKIHQKVIELQNDWVGFNERFNEYSPERESSWEESESWSNSSC